MFFNSSYTQIRREHSSKRENVNFILSDRRRAKTTKTPGTVPECYLYRGLCDQSNGTFSRVRDERDDRRVINARTNGFSFLPSLLPRYFHLCPSRAAARAHTRIRISRWHALSYVKRRRDEKSPATGFHEPGRQATKLGRRSKESHLLSPSLFLSSSYILLPPAPSCSPLPFSSCDSRPQLGFAFYASPNYGLKTTLRTNETRKREREQNELTWYSGISGSRRTHIQIQSQYWLTLKMGYLIL